MNRDAKKKAIIRDSIFLTLLIVAWIFEPEPDPNVQHAVVTLVTLIVGIGLAALSGYLLQKRQKNIAEADKPTTLASRGSFVPVILGVRRVGPIFGWAGNRRTQKEDVGGGKGGVFSSPKQRVFYEAGWHKLAVGRGICIRRIRQQGKIIFEGPITRFSHPSGSLVDIGKEGSFRVYWGERTQPKDPILGDANAEPPLNIDSRWPGLFHIVWEEKRLGPQPNWPLLDYEIEVRPDFSETLLTRTNAYSGPSFNLEADSFPILDFQDGPEWNGTNSATAGAYIVDEEIPFDAKGRIRVTGNTGLAADVDIDIVGGEFFLATVGFYGTTGIPIINSRTRVFPVGGVSGGTADGSVTKYKDQEDDGLNPAHIIAEVLFGPPPVGNALPQDEWDLESLEVLGELAEAENLRCSYQAINGEDVDAAIGALLQDVGVMVPLDTATGLIKFVPIREVAAVDIKSITADNLDDPLPEIEHVLGDPRTDRMVFIFPDRQNAHNDMPVQVDDDGSASYGQFHKARQIRITSTVNYATAAPIAERRSQEELASYSALRDLRSGRDARSLLPGDVVTVNDYPEPVRVSSVKPQLLEDDVNIDAMPDHYGQPITPFVAPQGNTGGPLLPAALDLEAAIVEIPEHADPSIGQAIIVPRIRAHAQIDTADFYLSRDNTSYTFVDDTGSHQAGGDLVDALPAEGAAYLPTGPTFQVLGPDISQADSVTPLGDADWRAGRLFCVIVTEIQAEICFVQNIVMTAPGVYRLDGLLRGRFDTQLLDHAAGSQVFLFEQADIDFLQDVLLAPSVDLFVKIPTNSSEGTIPLSGTAPVSIQLEGKGVRPMRPAEVRVLEPFLQVPVYVSGGNVKVQWMHRSTASPATGAGQQPAGTAIAAPSAIRGTFEIDIDDGGGATTLVAGAVNEFEITNAQIVAAFGGNPVTFDIRVFNQDGGLRSLARSITVTRI